MGDSASAWDVARAAAASAGVALVPLDGLHDAERLVGVVEQVWGEGELSFALVRAFQHAGGGLYGAQAGDTLAGFVLGFLGWQDGLHLHSHMLAVLPERQSKGIGYALKLAQRAACLDAGVEDVRWTFDPLVVRNAWFNLAKLGTVATAFLPGFYGEMTDMINRGDRTDRFEVRWSLRSARVDRALSGQAQPPPARGPILLECVGDGDTAHPKETGATPEPGAMVAVPADHAALRRSDPGLGRAWREASGRVFEACFAAGLSAAWITRDREYVFVPTEDATG